MTEITPPEGALHIIKKLTDGGHRALFVGGCVRDYLLGLRPTDWDIATDAMPEEITSLFDKTLVIGARFGVVSVILNDGNYEVAQFRAEGPYFDGRHPSSVEPANEKQDAMRRDITINGMFFDPIKDQLLDYVGGQEDIHKELIRAIGEPGKRFEEDHLRMLRALRFAARFEYGIETGTYSAIQRLAPLIERTSAERKRDELTSMLTSGRADIAFGLMRETGILTKVLPEVARMTGVAQPPEFHPEGDVWAHTIKALGMLESPSSIFAWAVLLHDVGKPDTFSQADRIRFNNHDTVGAQISEQICERLNMSGHEKSWISNIVKNHMKFREVKNMRESTLKRFLREPFFSELIELHRIDQLAGHGNLETYGFCLEQLALTGDNILHPRRTIDGNDLTEMGFEPGPLFQNILTSLENEQLEGRALTYAEAEVFVIKKFGNLRTRKSKRPNDN
ncbi:MAG: CCA tRNA nucleotidyltransferase [Nitrospinaceae bacterium]|jgi:poly(A) polymerase|nr:CCA tRNA nucleotidyltransferase [Nitrospinaceae bacterium]MBT3433711.1 CCA tRNA nucleotidyltransferase [Nitrospinaceae bacterium]MBT3823164.1 CCA tRNA nucleotidyltransferase [Nitrospinaceae bacterium]MBT4429256.1 CCA tRNA nucleotidyltransferase [Nitrospinaceae bacterium]MBT5368885.1 CCA tRNA nucleotidyltransferase [Nitrospinaceae bacterium]